MMRSHRRDGRARDRRVLHRRRDRARRVRADLRAARDEAPVAETLDLSRLPLRDRGHRRPGHVRQPPGRADRRHGATRPAAPRSCSTWRSCSSTSAIVAGITGATHRQAARRHPGRAGGRLERRRPEVAAAMDRASSSTSSSSASSCGDVTRSSPRSATWRRDLRRHEGGRGPADRACPPCPGPRVGCRPDRPQWDPRPRDVCRNGTPGPGPPTCR